MDREHRKFYNAIETLREMMLLRGKGWEIDTKNLVADMHSTIIQNKDTLIVMSVDGSLNPKRVSVPALTKTVIFCTRNKIPRQDLLEDLYFVQYFTLNELQYNVTKHVLVPEHRLMSDIETERLMQAYQIDTPLKFPHILVIDPVIKFLGGRLMQMVEISRENGAKTYRTIVDVDVDLLGPGSGDN